MWQEIWEVLTEALCLATFQSRNERIENICRSTSAPSPVRGRGRARPLVRSAVVAAYSCSIIVAALETVAWPGFSSTLSDLTTPSSTSIE